VTKNDLSNNKDDSRFIKSTESRADSQPSKKTHTLTKQDSSVYLKGNSQDKILKRTQRSANSTMDSRGKVLNKNIVSASNERVISSQTSEHHSVFA
jgi:hypothetical protein